MSFVRGTVELVHVAAQPGSLRDMILGAWTQTRMDWMFARNQLSRWLRQHGRLRSSERRFAGEVIYGMIRHIRRIDEALKLAGVAKFSHPPDLLRLLAYLVLELSLDAKTVSESAKAAGFTEIDWSVIAAADEKISAMRDPTRRLAVLRSLPDWLAQRLAHQYEGGADPLAAALLNRAPLTLRVNLRKASIETVIGNLSREKIVAQVGRYSSSALIVEGWPNVAAFRGYRDGLFEIQDQASQVVVDLVAAKPGQRVVDFCAGAGGKTLGLADAIKNQGRIVATDTDDKKLSEMKRRSRRAGISCVRGAVLDENGWSKALEPLLGKADRVLVDAPCTGLGSLRRHPEVKWRLAEGEIASYAALQKELIDRAASLLNETGQLVYATCSLLQEENQQVIESVVKNNRLEIVPASEVLGEARANEVGDGRFLAMDPHQHGTDGFFAAVMRRRCE